MAISSSGTLAYVVDAASAPPTLAWVDDSGRMESAGELPVLATSVDLSSQSGLAVVGLATTPRRTLLWDVQRGVPTGLRVIGATPRWHPDGRRFVIARGEQLLLVNADDGRETVLASTAGGGASLRAPSFSADGQSVVYAEARGARSDIYALRPSEKEPRPILATEANEHSPALSPDGRWLAYVEGTSPPQIYVIRFPEGTARRRITTTAGNQPLWRRDGRALFYREDPEREATGRNQELRMVPIDAGDTLTLGTPRSLFPVVTPSAPLISVTFNNEGPGYHASADGGRFLMVYQPQPTSLTEIAVVQHWYTELQRLAPRKQ
jgi:dipeptidyl aminopeptidase/acylaminoacyl peptidase